jgi:hypothetical protein
LAARPGPLVIAGWVLAWALGRGRGHPILEVTLRAHRRAAGGTGARALGAPSAARARVGAVPAAAATCGGGWRRAAPAAPAAAAGRFPPPAGGACARGFFSGRGGCAFAGTTGRCQNGTPHAGTESGATAARAGSAGRRAQRGGSRAAPGVCRRGARAPFRGARTRALGAPRQRGGPLARQDRRGFLCQKGAQQKNCWGFAAGGSRRHAAAAPPQRRAGRTGSRAGAGRGGSRGVRLRRLGCGRGLSDGGGGASTAEEAAGGRRGALERL